MPERIKLCWKHRYEGQNICMDIIKNKKHGDFKGHYTCIKALNVLPWIQNKDIPQKSHMSCNNTVHFVLKVPNSYWSDAEHCDIDKMAMIPKIAARRKIVQLLRNHSNITSNSNPGRKIHEHGGGAEFTATAITGSIQSPIIKETFTSLSTMKKVRLQINVKKNTFTLDAKKLKKQWFLFWPICLSSTVFCNMWQNPHM